MVDIKDFRRDGNGSSDKWGKKLFLFGFIFVVLLVLYYAGNLYLDYVQVKEVGTQYTEIFLKNLVTEAVIQVISFFALFVIALLSILFVRRNFAVQNLHRGALESKKLSFLIGVIFAFIASSVVSEELCEKYLMFTNSQQFGEADPIFGKDVGYYVFQRPFLESVVSSLLSIWTVLSVLIFFVYWFLGVVYNERSIKEVIGVKRITVHNCVNLSVLLLLFGLSYVFKAEDILYKSFSDLNGAGFTDKTIWLNYYRIAPFLMIVLVVVAARFVAKDKNIAALKTILVFPALWVAVLLVAVVVQSFIVAPNEVIREQDNIVSNIKATQAAYGIDDISEVVFDVKNDLTVEKLNNHEEVTDNIRILDLSANLTVLNQIQGIRNYYRFNETDIVPYEINGKKTAVAITPREMTKANLQDNTDTYINKTLRYTHGFGVTMNVINKVTSQGQPEFLIKDIPPKSEAGIPEIKQPRIYYGELTDDYVVVGSQKYKELDYSEGQEDVEFSYDGTGGVELGLWNRLVFALKYGDVRLLVSDLVSSDSRILINRDVVSRLETVAPFFAYDGDPYMIIDAQGRLKWVVDAYTTTNRYPYSQRYGERNFNYIRNSVKAVVDAYDGSVTFYISDSEDPIVATYASIYPNLFSEDDIPDDIKRHIKYPEYMFKIQSDMYGKYHISNPSTFYNKNDMWVIAQERYGSTTEAKELAAYYNMMKLEGEDEAELLLTVPFTLANKDNMVAWLAVRNEWKNYGKLQVYKFPKGISVSGPMQIENRINSDKDISKELNLWSQGDSQVIRGNMIVVPIENSVLYVEPIYIASSNQSALPELKQVVVAYDEKIVMANSLEEALMALFSQDGSLENVPNDTVQQKPSTGEKPDKDKPVTFEDAAQSVVDEFKRMKGASAENNWSEFGESMNALEESVAELEKYLPTEESAEEVE